MTMDIENFYLKMPMERYKCIHLKLSTLPNDGIKEYRLHEKLTHGSYFYVKVNKGMYGLAQAEIIAQKLLKNDW